MKRCPSKGGGDADGPFRCGLPVGHDGDHSALTETGTVFEPDKPPLSEAQFKTLEALASGYQPAFVPAITRRWLRTHGLIEISGGKRSGPLAITAAGRTTLATMPCRWVWYPGVRAGGAWSSTRSAVPGMAFCGRPAGHDGDHSPKRTVADCLAAPEADGSPPWTILQLATRAVAAAIDGAQGEIVRQGGEALTQLALEAGSVGADAARVFLDEIERRTNVAK